MSARPKTTSRTRSRPAPATEGLSPLDTDRAASLADEGGASAAATETQERDHSEGADKIRENVESVEAKAGRKRERAL